ncbi:DUF1269 domain-containing family protein [uncultured Lactobacillus sp.]|uniref:DUF1269 domain-containing family protein n=1 Tax=uncultured Lactobacillus sp. TaxID=153152 RepID=UPI002602B736|nr:DUF1269 domain-containing family protein [uncultured Lactobacillus sp.]
MSKVGSFILGSVIGLGAGLVAASMLLPDDAQEDLKKKIAENDKLQDLKEKYDKGTETIKTQLKSFPKSVEDDSELKDFDDIVIDDTSKDLGDDDKTNKEAVSDLKNSEGTN